MNTQSFNNAGFSTFTSTVLGGISSAPSNGPNCNLITYEKGPTAPFYPVPLGCRLYSDTATVSQCLCTQFIKNEWYFSFKTAKML